MNILTTFHPLPRQRLPVIKNQQARNPQRVVPNLHPLMRVREDQRVVRPRRRMMPPLCQHHHRQRQIHRHLNQYSAMVNAASLQLKQENSFLLTPQMEFVMMMICVSRALVVMD